MTSSIGIMTSQPLFQNTITLRRPGIIKIITRFIKKILKDSRKVKRIRNYVSKSNLKICWLLVKKCLCQQNPRVCVTGFIYFLNLLLCQVSSLYDMCDSFYGRGIFCPQPPPSPHLWATLKMPIVNRVKEVFHGKTWEGDLWKSCWPWFTWM